MASWTLPGWMVRMRRRRDCGMASGWPLSPPASRSNLVQKWLGHAQLTTTAIYANPVGEEEQSIAARMW